MHCLARTSLGMLGLALIAPMGVGAQDVSSSAPAGYQAAAPSVSPAPVGLDGKPIPASPAPAPHKHTGRTLCAKCAAKAQAQANAMPPGKIVGCAHSKNGVCTACQAALNMPGQFVVMGAPAPAPEAPGRAVASSHPSPSAAHMASRPGRAVASSSYDGPSGDPTPVGVIQANFSPAATSATSAAYANPASQPGRAVAESNAGHDPYQAKSGGFPHPHILGHIFGWSGLGAERAEERARKKAEAHAMIPYENGAEAAPVNDLPASMVYGKKR